MLDEKRRIISQFSIEGIHVPVGAFPVGAYLIHANLINDYSNNTVSSKSEKFEIVQRTTEKKIN